MELTDNNYERVIKNNTKPVYIDFYSPTCQPCQMLLAVVDNGLIEYGRAKGVMVVKCDVSKNPKLANAFKVESVPFTIAVMPDGKLKYPEIGLKNNGYYFEIVDKLVSKGSFFSRLFG